jgi:peptidoglycan biosynthesis protein MviN/MurJ (putative lipid II flippase)
MMGTNGPGNPILQVLLLCVIASVALAAIGFWLRGRGMLRQPVPALGWAILTILPLFGAGFAMFAKHGVEQATGETKAGVNAPDVKGAP